MNSDTETDVEDITDGHVATVIGKWHVFKTLALYAAFLSAGFSCVLLGTTMIDMEIILNTDTKHIATVFTGDGVGYLLGAMLCGLLFNRFCGEIQIGVACFLKGVLLILTPWIPSLPVYFLLTLLGSVTSGYIDASSQAYTVFLWKGHRYMDPVMQGGHAAFTVSATIAPFLVRLFVAPDHKHTSELPFNMSISEDISASSSTDKTQKLLSAFATSYEHNGAINGLNTTSFGQNEINYTHDATDYIHNTTDILDSSVPYDGSVQYVFVAFGAFYFIPAFCMLYYVWQENIPLLQVKDRKLDKKKGNNTPQKVISRIPKIVFYILSFLFAFLYIWMEAAYPGYIAIYAVRGLGYPKSIGLISPAVFFGCLGLGRFLGIPLSTILQKRTMLMMDLLLIAFGLVCLLFVNVHPAIIWVGTALCGLGMSSMFPTMVLWLSEHITFEGIASGILHTGCSVGFMIGPTLTGVFFQSFGHQWFVYLLMIACVSNLVVYASMEILVHFHGNSLKFQPYVVHCEESEGIMECQKINGDT